MTTREDLRSTLGQRNVLASKLTRMRARYQGFVDAVGGGACLSNSSEDYQIGHAEGELARQAFKARHKRLLFGPKEGV